MAPIPHLRKDLAHSQNPTENQVFSAGRLKRPKHRLGLCVRSCLSVGRVIRIQGFSPSKPPSTDPLARPFGRRSHLQDSVSATDPDQSSGGLQKYFVQACHSVPCGSGCVYPLIHACIDVLHLSAGKSFPELPSLRLEFYITR